MVTMPMTLGDPYPPQTTPFCAFCNTFLYLCNGENYELQIWWVG